MKKIKFLKITSELLNLLTFQTLKFISKAISFPSEKNYASALVTLFILRYCPYMGKAITFPSQDFLFLPSIFTRFKGGFTMKVSLVNVIYGIV